MAQAHCSVAHKQSNLFFIGEMKLIESETLDSTIASFFYEMLGRSMFNVADSPSFAALVDQSQPDLMHNCTCTRAASFIIPPHVHHVPVWRAYVRSHGARMRASARAAPRAGT